MNDYTIVNQVIILFFLMAAGFVAKKRDIIDNNTIKKLSEVLVRITLPAMIIYSYNRQFSKELLAKGGIMLAYSLAIHLFGIFLGSVLYRKYPRNIKDVLKFITIYSNCGYMGLPVLEALYGQTGVFLGSIYVTVFNLFTWTNGVMIFTGKGDVKSIKNALLSPGIIAIFIGLAIFFFPVKLPYPVLKTLEILGTMTTPLSMLIIGALIANTEFKSLFSGSSLYYSTVIRLILLPLLTLAVLKIAGITDHVLLGSCVATAAMPAAANTAVFAERYGGDSIFASRVVAFQTLLSMITIPAILILV
ncbi:MAG: AEC family transporter [Clostridiaceae bacterium]|nr:AEC family transporter [Clostridiaceae bacterium]